MALNKEKHNTMSNLEQLLYLQRLRKRRERQEQVKENNHWIFLAGTLVAKYLKEDLEIPVYKGKDAKQRNAAAFVPLENILAYLAEHKEFTNQLKERANPPPPNNF